MKTLISIDAGMSTGVVVGTYSDDQPFELTHAFQFEGGVEGFIKNFKVSTDEDWAMHFYAYAHIGQNTSVELYQDETFYHEGWDTCEEDHFCPEEIRVHHATVIAEKFTARGSGNGFSYRTDALEPLRVEGAILAMGLNPEWCSPAQQYFAGGKGAEAKKRAHAWLKDNGLYISPKSVGCKDANDARSAALHAISYLRRIHHMPTLKHYFGGNHD